MVGGVTLVILIKAKHFISILPSLQTQGGENSQARSIQLCFTENSPSFKICDIYVNKHARFHLFSLLVLDETVSQYLIIK